MFRRLKRVIYALLVASSILSVTTLCHAALRDPTRPVYSTGKSSIAAPAQSEPIVSAIRISRESKWVVINGVTAKQGQTIAGGIEVVEIRTKSVVIKQKNKLRELYLVGQHYKKY